MRQVQVAELQVDCSAGRLEPRRFLIGGQRLGVMPLLGVHVSKPLMGRQKRRAGRQRRLVLGDRLRVAPLRGVQVAEPHVGRRQLRVRLQRPPIRLERLGVLPHSQERPAETERGQDEVRLQTQRLAELLDRLALPLLGQVDVPQGEAHQGPIGTQMQGPTEFLRGLLEPLLLQVDQTEAVARLRQLGIVAQSGGVAHGGAVALALPEIDVPQAEVRHGRVRVLLEDCLELLHRLGVFLLLQVQVADHDTRLGPLPQRAQPGDGRLRGRVRLVHCRGHRSRSPRRSRSPCDPPQRIGCSAKKFHITSFEMSLVVLPRYQVITGLPPGQVWPPPSMVHSPTAVPSAQ